MNNIEINESKFIISLDFEKMWGVFDNKTIENYGSNIKNVDIVIERTLALFEKYEIHATWAFVGMLLHIDIESLKSSLPFILPNYKIKKISAYSHFELIKKEDFDVFYSGVNSINKIKNTPNQELATHTYSHYYCLEDGSTLDSFRCDLEKSIEISKYNNISFSSIIFPRNQYNYEYLSLCSTKNIKAYRGTENNWIQKSRNQSELNLGHRLLRLLDSYINITGYNVYNKLSIDDSGLVNIPSSFFFRPYNKFFYYLEYFKIKRFKKAMLYAAKNCSLIHFWWHPHNFGQNLNENFEQLESILIYYSELNQLYGMKSKSMQEICKENK
jgi:hypothetical protein